jgi:hypothetical protein
MLIYYAHCSVCHQTKTLVLSYALLRLSLFPCVACSTKGVIFYIVPTTYYAPFCYGPSYTSEEEGVALHLLLARQTMCHTYAMPDTAARWFWIERGRVLLASLVYSNVS